MSAPTTTDRIPSLAAVARATTSERDFSFALRDFLDGFQARPAAAALAEEPPALAGLLADGGRADAYLAAVCDHLSRGEKFQPPAWCRSPSRTLEQPFFAARSHPMRMLLLVDSPAAFGERNIFVSADALTRV